MANNFKNFKRIDAFIDFMKTATEDQRLEVLRLDIQKMSKEIHTILVEHIPEYLKKFGIETQHAPTVANTLRQLVGDDEVIRDAKTFETLHPIQDEMNAFLESLRENPHTYLNAYYPDEFEKIIYIADLFGLDSEALSPPEHIYH